MTRWQVALLLLGLALLAAVVWTEAMLDFVWPPARLLLLLAGPPIVAGLLVRRSRRSPGALRNTLILGTIAVILPLAGWWSGWSFRSHGIDHAWFELAWLGLNFLVFAVFLLPPSWLRFAVAIPAIVAWLIVGIAALVSVLIANAVPLRTLHVTSGVEARIYGDAGAVGDGTGAVILLRQPSWAPFLEHELARVEVPCTPEPLVTVDRDTVEIRSDGTLLRRVAL